MISTAHYQKYEILASRIGIQALKRVLPASAKEIITALEKDDHHLNTIPLAKWDKAAGYISGLENYSDGPTRLSFAGPWSSPDAHNLSLAERVCVLKHVARHHL